MKRYILVFAAACALAACNNGNNNNNSDSADSKKMADKANDQKFDDSNRERDADFAVKAADGGMMEVALGRLAQTKGSTAEVRTFGGNMVTDHSAANAELKALAAQKNITLPDTLSQDKQDKYNDLAKKSGMDFDKAYIDFMVDDHKDDIDEFQKEADKGNDPELKNWASQKLPTLRHHLMMAEDAQKMVKDKK